jgi:hypothetical protein
MTCYEEAIGTERRRRVASTRWGGARRARALVAMAIVASAMVGATAGTASAGAPARAAASSWSWSVAQKANIGQGASNSLTAVACAGGACFAVGHATGTSGRVQTLVDVLDGKAWSPAPSPAGAAGTDDYLQGVACPSRRDCWAVGWYSVGPAVTASIIHTLIEHFDGRAWSVVSSPGSPPGEQEQLEAVTCPTALDCWAVGNVSGTSGQNQATGTLIEHYAGRSWSVVPSPSATSVQALLAHLRPESFGAPIFQLTGVACATASDCWAVGQSFEANGGGGVDPLWLHGDAGHWAVPAGHAGGTLAGAAFSVGAAPCRSCFPSGSLTAISCPALGRCWAVGGGPKGPLLMREAGPLWRLVPNAEAYFKNAGQLTGVGCPSVTTCVAGGWIPSRSYLKLGSGSPTATAAALVGIGTPGSFSALTPPNIASGYVLNALACVAPNDCFAVGSSGGSSGTADALVLSGRPVGAAAPPTSLPARSTSSTSTPSTSTPSTSTSRSTTTVATTQAGTTTTTARRAAGGPVRSHGSPAFPWWLVVLLVVLLIVLLLFVVLRRRKDEDRPAKDGDLSGA